MILNKYKDTKGRKRNLVQEVLPNLPKGSLKLGDVLGRGSSGIVYKAIWNGTTAVAVKQLPVCMLADEQSMREFEEEAHRMNSLKHPNVVTFYGIYKGKDHYSIVMEYMSQGSLDRLLYDSSIQLSFIPTRWQIIENFTSALDYLHGCGLGHRDVKSGNLLVYILDGQYRVKITDFGISKQQEQGQTRSMTKGVGTPIYMAPEILSRDRDYNPLQTDVYSYGVVLWEIYTREEPYKEVVSQWDIPAMVKRGERPTIPMDCPQSYARLITDCWSHEASRRPIMSEVIRRFPDIKESFMPCPT